MTRWLQLQILKQWSNLDRCFEGTQPSPTCYLIMVHNTPPWSTEIENVSLIFQDKNGNLFFPGKINYKCKNGNFISKLPSDSAMEFILIPRSLEWQFRDFIWNLRLKELSPTYNLWCTIRIWCDSKVKIRHQDYCGAQEIPYYKIQKTYRWPSLLIFPVVILSSPLIQAFRDEPQIWLYFHLP